MQRHKLHDLNTRLIGILDFQWGISMQRIRRSIVSLRRIYSRLWVSLRRTYNRLWAFLLLLYSGTILIFLILGISIPSLLILPFCLFVPGYALVAVLFPQLRNLEKAFTSIAFSIALFVGVKSFIQAFVLMDPSSELPVVIIFSAICLITKLIMVIKSGKS